MRESDVRVRPGKGSRPRTKDRPKHKNAKFGMVITKDRGRWGVALDDGPRVTAMRARELGRTAIEVGDRVGVVGDTSGKKDTLARIVKLEERTSVLRRTADDTDPYERIVVANADQMLIVTAVADPPPRSGFVERDLGEEEVGADAAGSRNACLRHDVFARQDPQALLVAEAAFRAVEVVGLPECRINLVGRQ